MNRREFLKSAPAAATAAGLAQGASSFAAGFAERDITPEIGMEQPGGYGKAYLRSFHDPCKVRAAVFADGPKRVALVSMDALIAPRQLVEAARRGIEAQCGIPAANVMIGASHSHSSGPVAMVQPGEYDHASDFVKKLAYEQSSCANAAYLERVREQIVKAVCQADGSRRPLRCGVGMGHEEKVAFNRRFRMRNGQSWTHPGKGNPGILKPAGPIDPQVGVVGAWETDGRLAGCVVNYSCHATTSPGGISANWIYYMEKAIRGIYGPDVVVLFMAGHCGDVTQVDNLSPYQDPGSEAWAQLVGMRIGAESARVLMLMHPGELTPVNAASSLLTFERRKPSPARVRRAMEMVSRDPKEVGPANWTFAKEIVLLDALLAKWPQGQAEVQAVQVGPAVFVSAPGEMFVEWGLQIKAKSKFPFTFPVELANGCVGYVPTEEALGPGGGGYETRLTSYSNLEPGAGQKMVDTGVALSARFQPGAVPTPPKAPPFREPWAYGNVPPELS